MVGIKNVWNLKNVRLYKYIWYKKNRIDIHTGEFKKFILLVGNKKKAINMVEIENKIKSAKF